MGGNRSKGIDASTKWITARDHPTEKPSILVLIATNSYTKALGLAGTVCVIQGVRGETINVVGKEVGTPACRAVRPEDIEEIIGPK